MANRCFRPILRLRKDPRGGARPAGTLRCGPAPWRPPASPRSGCGAVSPAHALCRPLHRRGRGPRPFRPGQVPLVPPAPAQAVAPGDEGLRAPRGGRCCLSPSFALSGAPGMSRKAPSHLAAPWEAETRPLCSLPGPQPCQALGDAWSADAEGRKGRVAVRMCPSQQLEAAVARPTQVTAPMQAADETRWPFRLRRCPSAEAFFVSAVGVILSTDDSNSLML